MALIRSTRVRVGIPAALALALALTLLAVVTLLPVPTVGRNKNGSMFGLVSGYSAQRWSSIASSFSSSNTRRATHSSSSFTTTVRRNVAASFIDGPSNSKPNTNNINPMDDGDRKRLLLLDEMLFLTTELDFSRMDQADAETELLVERRRELLRTRRLGTAATSSSSISTATCRPTEMSNYQFQLPLPRQSSSPLFFGMTVVEVKDGIVDSDRQLDLDTILVNNNGVNPPLRPEETAPPSGWKDALTNNNNGSASGLMVASVVADSPADKAGVKPGDFLTAVSGSAAAAASSTITTTPTTVSTIEGVQLALLSQTAIASGSVTFELQRLVSASPNVLDAAAAATTTTSPQYYELTLTRPLGFQVGESSDGYVVVTGIKDSAANLVRHAVAVGDRVVAIDSSLGDTLWPVSTVEGAISAVTGRLPGQDVTVRFERPASAASVTAATAISESPSITMVSAVPKPVSDVIVVAIPIAPDKNELIKRCREVLKRYSAKDAEKRNTAVLQMSAQVADKVVDALACASATIDCVTLSMIMNAYLQSNQAKSAIRVFESATGFSGDGSINPIKEIIKGKTGSQIVPSESSVNLFTGTALLKAHGKVGDYHSVSRVLAALEGRSGEVDEKGLESAPWPWTGAFGTIQPDTVCYNVAIAAAEKVGGDAAVHQALVLFDRMADKTVKTNKKSEGPFRNEVTYNTLISALCNAGRPEQALKVFEQMKKAGLRPDKFTYTSLIRVCVQETDIQELLYDMRESGARPDVVTYNTMIQSLCNKRQLTQATKLVTEMESRGISPDSRTYGALMTGLMRARKPSACLTLFESACANSRSASLTENVHLFTTAISAASVLGDHERALELVTRMKAVGVKPNLKTLTAVMGACLASGKPDLAAQLYKKIERPDGYATRQGIRAFCACGDISSAIELLQTDNSGLSGRQMMLSYENVIIGAMEQKHYNLAQRTVDDLLVKGYIPSKQIVLAMISAMSTDSRIEDERDASERFRFLLYLLDSLQARNLPIEADLYLATVTLGSRLTGTPRLVASLLVRARSNVKGVREEFFSVSKGTAFLDATSSSAQMNPRMTGWVDILDTYEFLPKNSFSMERLPLLPIRIAPRDTIRILRAEQKATIIKRRRTAN